MAGKAGAVRAGGAFVEIFADKSALVRGLKGAEKTLTSWGKNVSKAGFAATAAGAAVGGGLAAAVKVFADSGSQLADMSVRTGASVESLGKLGYAAGQTGTDMEAVEKGTKKLQDNLAGAVSGNKTAAASFAKLGLDARKLVNLPVDQQFARIADRLEAIQNPALRTAAAIDLFGKAGTDMLPMLAGGAAGLDALTSRAEKLGLVMSTQDAAAADKLGDRLDDVMAVGKRTTQVIGSALAPAATELANKVIDVGVAVNQWIVENPQLVTTIAEVTAAVTAGGVAVVGLGYSMQFAGTALGGIAKIVPLLVSPLTLTAAGFAAAGAAGYYFFTATDLGQQSLEYLADTFPGVAEQARASFGHIGGLASQLKTTVTTTWGGISDAVAAGDLALAGEIAMAGLQVVFQTGWREVSDLFTVTSTYLLDVWNGVSSSMAAVGEHVTHFLTTLWIDAAGLIVDAWSAAKRGVITSQEAMSTLILDVGYKLGIFSGSKEDAQRALREQTASRMAAVNQDQDRRHAEQQAKRQSARENLQAGLRGIDSNRKKRSDQLQQDQNAALLNSQKKLQNAQNKLNDLRDKAATAAADAAEEDEEQESKKPPTEIDDQLTEKAGVSNTGGTFSGLASSLQRGEVSDPMDRLRVAIERNTDAVKEKTPSIGLENAKRFGSDGMPLAADLANARMPDVSDHVGNNLALSIKPDAVGSEQQNGLLTEIRDALNTLNGRVAETGTFTP